MPSLICPVCGAPLEKIERTMRCGKGHSFDLAKQNYVNLLMRNQSADKRHGDDKRMVSARTAFLDAGYYAPLQDALCTLAEKYAGKDLIDAGCGEGYYTAAVRQRLEDACGSCSAVGIDISKTALIAASKRDPELTLAVSGISRLPVADSSCDLIMNVFAPNDDGEFSRVLRPNGVLLKAVPLEQHLYSLKAAVYEKPYRNPEPEYSPDGFSVLERVDVCYTIELKTGEQIENLFMMTPYYYKTSADDQKKLLNLDTLTTEVAFGIFVCIRTD